MRIVAFRKRLVKVYKQGGKRFNTSHVVIYQIPVKQCFNRVEVSIHLMLLFISLLVFILVLSGLVSIHLMLLFIERRKLQVLLQLKFQYISCCYLSGTTMLQVSPKAFQYISCCYLSYPLKKISIELSSFNTSHVVIYQDCYFFLLSAFTAFQYISCCYLS